MLWGGGGLTVGVGSIVGSMLRAVDFILAPFEDVGRVSFKTSRWCCGGLTLRSRCRLLWWTASRSSLKEIFWSVRHSPAPASGSSPTPSATDTTLCRQQPLLVPTGGPSWCGGTNWRTGTLRAWLIWIFRNCFGGGPGLLGVFAEAALAMLLKNIQFTKALVNGGTSFADGAPPELLAERQAWYRMKERSCPPSRGTSRSTACHRSSPP